MPLRDGGSVSGSTTGTLALNAVSKADEGAYRLVLSNGFGNMTSLVATLTVRDPFIVSQPASASRKPGESVTFDVTAVGSGPLGYQWYHDGRPVPGAVGASLALATVTAADAGAYTVVVSHSLGSITSAPAVLTVNLVAVDTSFNVVEMGSVKTLALHADGRVLAGGDFSALGGQPRSGIARLHPNGTADAGFPPTSQSLSSPQIRALALQADGKVLVGGEFTSLGGQAGQNICRLNEDGTLDARFDPRANRSVLAIVLQADGRILVGGAFAVVGGRPRASIGRLDVDGAVDATFDPGADGAVQSMVLQANGAIWVGGSFNQLAGQRRGGLGRLRVDGTPDLEFAADAQGTVHGLALLADGRALVGGQFQALAGHPRGNLARLLSAEPAAQDLRYDGATVTWTRGGSSPEVWRTSFEVSSDGLAWTQLGSGARVPGGWQRPAGSLPATGTLRARGHVAGGDRNGSGGLLEARIGFASPQLASEPASLTLDEGDTASFAVVAAGAGPYRYQWSKDGVPLVNQRNVSGADSATLVVSGVSAADDGTYRVAVGNAFGSVTSSPAILTVLRRVPLLDEDFDPVGEGANISSFEALALQPDGRILVGGFFGGLGGPNYRELARLHGDGTLDGDFRPDDVGIVYSMVLQSDGKILVGGTGRPTDGQWRDSINRLHRDGRRDAGFRPEAMGYVRALALQPDGRILAGGSLTEVAGVARRGIASLHPDGAFDAGFHPEAHGIVNCLALQTDGRILVGGAFTNLAGQARRGIARLHPDGTLDDAFDPGVGGGVPEVTTVVVQPDGKILVAGWFGALAGRSRNSIGRLHPDGSLDEGFDPRANSAVFSLALQANGKVLMAGLFTTVAGKPRSFMARLDRDGSLDRTFDPAADGWVTSLALQEDGRVLVGGYFSNVTGRARGGLARLNNNEPATGTLKLEGDTVQWIRGSSRPEVLRTTLESSFDGSTWTDLGTGTRRPDGWQWAGIALPPNADVRVRGHVTGGRYAGSGWPVEAMLARRPGIRLNLVRDGSSVTLGWTGGSGPFQVQQAANPASPEAWQDLGSPVEGSSITLPLGADRQFFRIRAP